MVFRSVHGWPKLHPHVVEECSRLTVETLMAAAPEHFLTDNLAIDFIRGPYRGLRLVPRQHGPCKRWWVECPSCGKRRDALYEPPHAQAGDWRCRTCHSLVYASQRYGQRHPLRRDPANWTSRKRRTAQKRARKGQQMHERQAVASRRALAAQERNQDELSTGECEALVASVHKAIARGELPTT